MQRIGIVYKKLKRVFIRWPCFLRREITRFFTRVIPKALRHGYQKHLIDDLKKRKGFVLHVLRFLFYCLWGLSLSLWIRSILQRYHPSCWKRNKYFIVESYVLFWFMVEILFLGLLICTSLVEEDWFLCLAAGFLSYRLFDIFQAWVNQFVLMEMQEWKPIDPRRTLVLVFIGYVEIMISYAILAFVFQDTFSKPFCTVCQSLYYSVTTATTIGSKWEPISAGGYAIFYTQVMFAVLFVTAVIGQIFTYISKKTD